MTTFYIVRHGQTEWNVQRRLQGHLDSPLTEQGVKDAELCRMELANVEFDQAFSSDSLRAKRTAEIITLERELAVKTTELLRERNMGKYEGKVIDEVERELQEIIQRIERLSHAERLKAKWSEDQESDEDLIARFITFLREASVAYDDQTVLVVSHSGMLRALLIHLGYADYDTLPHGAIKNCGYLVLESDGVDFFIKETCRIEKSEKSKE